MRAPSPPLTAPVAFPTDNTADVTSDKVFYNFPSPTVAWALDFSRSPQTRVSVLRTVDGGKHWQRRFTNDYGTSVGMSTGSPLLVRFFDENHGFVGTYLGPMLRTSDGGASWKSLSLPDSGGTFVDFWDAMHGWLIKIPVNGQVGGSPHLYSTENGGDSWHRLPDPPAGTRYFVFRRTSEAWLTSDVSGPPRIYRSTDGGLSWQRRDIPVDKVTHVYGAWVQIALKLLSGDGVIASVACECSGGTMNFTSFDSGATWRLIPFAERANSDPVWIDVDLVVYQDDIHWWTIDKTILYRSSNAGQTWIQEADGLPDWKFQPAANDAKHAWAAISVIGGSGLATTNDAGLHWTQVSVPTPF